MGLEELRQLLEQKKVEARGLLETDVAKAEEVMKEVRELKKKITLMEEIEAEEKRDLERQRDKKNNEVEETNMPINEMRAITKSIMGKELSEEERANIKTTDNAAVVPKQFVNQLQEIKKGFGSLKEYCDVITVTKNEGTIPVVDLDQNTLPDVSEGDNITDGTLVTTELTYKCKKVGLIQSLTSELVEDAEIEIESLVNKNFAEITVVTENTRILKVLKDNATEVESPKDYSDIQMTIDKSVPAVKYGLVTFTNTDGYAYLKNLKDNQNRPLNLVTEVNGKYYFHNKELVVVDDTLLTATPSKKIFIVANPKEAVKFIERKGVTIARSTEAGFRDDTVKLRILERLDVIKGATRSIKKIEFEVTP
ncbi:phage major capsid protein [Clostridium tertium]|uniref:phage major capsid protein n=1 Tax=Clostridium tertium TaxID=1559 RepID=UPI00115754FE|nr:phage major capsid protein [Clostridium tertium]MDB1956028.1 phage major capsid protein [Clostridium tertium]MDB1959023.1 phage major capsid protein [Clostridium tertium]MDB1962100.1 phage major capsid protein [Clostridium tertium]MDB1967173.1 phage major capsid protein [Clostridium tertium]